MFICIWIACCLLLSAVSSQEEMSCYSSLVELNAAIAVKDPFSVESYVLCPNTTFAIDEDNDNQEEIQLHSNMNLLCGTDGSSSNNCTITGGFLQVVCQQAHFDTSETPNVYVSGLTLRAPRGASFLGSCVGDILFNDCVFEVAYIFCAARCKLGLTLFLHIVAGFVSGGWLCHLEQQSSTSAHKQSNPTNQGARSSSPEFWIPSTECSGTE